MPVIITPESELGKELAKWDTPKRLGGMAPNGFEPFPAMMYRAERWPGTGKPMVGHPNASTGVDPEAMEFTRKTQCTVNDREERDRRYRDGWRDSPDDALAAFEAAERAVADAAANAQFHARKMSEGAQQEFDAAQDAADFHDPDPAAPKKDPTPAFSLRESEVVAKLEAEKAALEAKLAELDAKPVKKQNKR